MKIYQTIIIGAGPAGLIAGKYLKDAIILEQKKEIGNSIHCIGISKKALERQRIKPNSSWVCSKIYKVERIMPNGKAIGNFHKKHIGFVVNKSSFETFLSRDLKAKIKFNTKAINLEFKNTFWKITTHKGECFRSKYIIGADGFNSMVRKKVFIENKKEIETVSGLEYLVKLEKKIDTKTVKIYLNNKEYIKGYGWVFPKLKNIVLLGVGGNGNLNEKMNKFLENIIKKRYGNYQILDRINGTVSSKKARFKFFKSNIMLAGDAAGLVDPIFKAGTNQAMTSGKIAAQCILKNQANSYEEKIKSMPFSDPTIFEAGKILYSLDNQILNALGSVLEKKGFSKLENLSGFLKFLSKPPLVKNIFILFQFFFAWKHNQDYLW